MSKKILALGRATKIIASLAGTNLLVLGAFGTGKPTLTRIWNPTPGIYRMEEILRALPTTLQDMGGILIRESLQGSALTRLGELAPIGLLVPLWVFLLTLTYKKQRNYQNLKNQKILAQKQGVPIEDEDEDEDEDLPQPKKAPLVFLHLLLGSILTGILTLTPS